MSKVEKIITIFLVICTLCLTAFVDVRKREAEKELTSVKLKLDSLQSKYDSIEADAYFNNIELNRYAVAYEIYVRRNPSCAQEYANIISDETE